MQTSLILHCHLIYRESLMGTIFRESRCVWIIVYWSETIFIIPLKKNTAVVKLFETYFGSDILASFAELQCQGTDTFGSARV